MEPTPDIRLRIYRDGAKPIDVWGFTTIDGKIVAEEPMRTKR